MNGVRYDGAIQQMLVPLAILPFHFWLWGGTIPFIRKYSESCP
jgi:hypothetical protein